jgi:flagellar L-ring protein precursor FlgH
MKKMRLTIVSVGMVCALSAGVALGQVAQPVPVGYGAVAPGDLAQQSGNSLMRAGAMMPQASADSAPNAGQSRMSAVSLLAVPPPQPKMLKKHDFIQVIIRESTQASSKGNTDAKKETSLDAHLDAYVKLTKQMQLRGVTPSPPLALTGATDSEFKADATSVREDSLVTRIGAEVLDVKPNGTLLIQAHKHIKLDGEERDYVLSGMCRVDDIGPDNTVLSTQLHDMEFTQMTKGIIHDTNERGFLSKLLAKLNPF